MGQLVSNFHLSLAVVSKTFNRFYISLCRWEERDFYIKEKLNGLREMVEKGVEVRSNVVSRSFARVLSPGLQTAPQISLDRVVFRLLPWNVRLYLLRNALNATLILLAICIAAIRVVALAPKEIQLLVLSLLSLFI